VHQILKNAQISTKNVIRFCQTKVWNGKSEIRFGLVIKNLKVKQLFSLQERMANALKIGINRGMDNEKKSTTIQKMLIKNSLSLHLS